MFILLLLHIAYRETVLVPIKTNLAIILIICYGLFVSYRGLRLLQAWRKTGAIIKSAYNAPLSEAIQTVKEKCCAEIGIENIPILFSSTIPGPVTIGNSEPLIILPESLLNETDESILTSAIGHEIVHISRRDYLFNLIYEFILLPLSFHPAAMLVKRRINQTRELSCDAAVAERLLQAEDYARSLVKLAVSASNLSRPALTTTVGMGDADNLETRVMSLLKNSKLNTYRKSSLIISGLLLVAVPCLVFGGFVLNVGIIDVSAQQTDKKELSKEEKQEVELKLKERRNNLDIIEEKVKKEKLEVELKEGQKYTLTLKEKMSEIVNDRMEQAKLARAAKITMQTAIQKALDHQAGTVIESRLGLEKDEVVYKILILDKDSTESKITVVVISGIDGRVVKTGQGFVK